MEHLHAQVKSGAILNAKESENVAYDVVEHLREQGMLTVQNEPQYQFLYDVILDHLKERFSGMMFEIDHDVESKPGSKRRVNKKSDDAMSDAAENSHVCCSDKFR